MLAAACVHGLNIGFINTFLEGVRAVQGFTLLAEHFGRDRNSCANESYYTKNDGFSGLFPNRSIDRD